MSMGGFTEAFAYSSYGTKSKEVYNIQVYLKEHGYYEADCDGIFGYETKKSVMEFQSDNGLKVDGIAGTKTLSVMNIVPSSDLMLLARVINGEARGEDYEGQVAVGAVVVNRMKHPSFPDTIHGVVYQKGAFSAVTDGQINKEISPSCIAAAEAALSGEDPTNGAVFYYNPQTATCKWIRTRDVIKQIGNHVFCM